MTYRLHNRLGSGGFVIQAALVAAKIDFEYRPVRSVPNTQVGEQVKELNPWGQVPILELEDGTRMTEVAAMLAHLSSAEPAIRMGPTLWVDNHPQFLRWAVFLSVNVYEAILRRSYTHRYFKDGPELSEREAVKASIREAAGERIHAAFKCIEAETSGYQFLLSDRLSACDIYLAMLYAWYNQKPDLPKCTWITTQVATHPEIGPIWEQNFHDRLDFKWHEL
ncbi:MAG: glutathione S-transferase family protein [Pseudomonadota bacterium]